LRIAACNIRCVFDLPQADASVVSFFSARRIAATDPEELAESYLKVNAATDGAQVAWSVEALRDVRRAKIFRSR